LGFGIWDLGFGIWNLELEIRENNFYTVEVTARLEEWEFTVNAMGVGVAFLLDSPELHEIVDFAAYFFGQKVLRYDLWDRVVMQKIGPGLDFSFAIIFERFPRVGWSTGLLGFGFLPLKE
jgi:hypothetical protein